MDSNNLNEAPKYTGKPVIARKGGKLGAVMVDPTGKPIPGSWIPKAEVPQKALKYLDPAKFSAAEKRNAERQAQIAAEKERLKGVGNAPTPPIQPPTGDDRSRRTTPPARQPAPAAAKPKPAPESPAVREYMKAAAAARKSGDAAQMAKVRDTGLDIWRKKYANTLAKNVTPAGTQRGTGQSVMAKQADELRGLRPAAPAPGSEKPGYSGPPTPIAPQAQSKLSGGAYSPAATAKMSQRTKNVLGVKEQYDAFDLVLEYLLSQGHVDTLEEALYVMMEMSSETVQEIVEGIMPEPINPEVHRRLQRIEKATKLQQGTKGAESQAAGSAVKRMGGSGVQLPGV